MPAATPGVQAAAAAKPIQGPALAEGSPTGWVRGGILVGAIGYSLTGTVGLAIGWRMAGRDVVVAAILWTLRWLAGRRPRFSSLCVVALVSLELLLSIHESPRLLSSSVLVFPLLILVSGLLLGAQAALWVGLVDAVVVPLAFLTGGGWGPGLSRFDAEDAINLIVYVVIVLGTGVVTRAALATHAQVLDTSERARRRYVDLFENAPDGMVALGAQGAITELNQLAARLLGRPREALIGQALSQVLRDAGAQAPLELDTARQGAPLLLELGLPGEAPRALEVQARTDPASAPGARLLVLRDVTERRALEEQLGHSQRLESVGQLAGGVAHDFNNLLTAVGGNAALLLEHPDPEVREMALDIQQAQLRGSALTQQLLAFARREVRKVEPVDLGEAAEQMARLLERLLGERHPLELARAGSTAVLADRTQLEQTLLNLVTNARDAMPDGGAVRVRVRKLGEGEAASLGSTLEAPAQVMLEVADTGVGMTAEVRERIFEPFFTTKPRGKGTGLGLSTVHGIVTSSGGRVAVDTAPGQGCRVRVFLPAVESAGSKPSMGALAPPPGGHERVLLVEDNPQVRALVTRVLSKAGYTVSVAADAESALELHAQAPLFDLLLTDVVMPGLTGPELAQRLAALQPGLRALFMSGYFEAGLASHGGFEPGRNLLHKPFEPEQLLRTVRAALETRLQAG